MSKRVWGALVGEPVGTSLSSVPHASHKEQLAQLHFLSQEAPSLAHQDLQVPGFVGALVREEVTGLDGALVEPELGDKDLTMSPFKVKIPIILQHLE